MAEVNQLRAQGKNLSSALASVGLLKSSYYYRPRTRRPRPLDERLVAALGQLEQIREDVYGYRKKTAYLRRQGHLFNPKKGYRHLSQGLRQGPGKASAQKAQGVSPHHLAVRAAHSQQPALGDRFGRSALVVDSVRGLRHPDAERQTLHRFLHLLLQDRGVIPQPVPELLRSSGRLEGLHRLV